MSEHKEHKQDVRIALGYRTAPSKAKCIRCGGKPLSKHHRQILRERREQEARLVAQQEAEQRAKARS